MFGEVFVIAFVLYLLGDTATRGKLSAVMRGTGKGVAKTGYRAAREGARRSGEQYATFLRSDAAPLRRTRKTARAVGRPVGKGARATWTGARDGVAAELARLREQIEAALEQAERARADAQNPAVGVTRGKFGHSFDVPPSPAADEQQPASNSLVGRCPKCRRVVLLYDKDGNVFPAPPLCGQCTAEQQQQQQQVTTPAAPTGAPGTQPEGITTMPTMTQGGGGPSVRVESVPGFIAAVGQLAELAVQISEQGVALGIGNGAQAGLEDAIDTLRGVATEVQNAYRPLVEAADATPKGAEQVTVGAARSE